MHGRAKCRNKSADAVALQMIQQPGGIIAVISQQRLIATLTIEQNDHPV